VTDVWTSFGVLIGVGAVAITTWQPLDPLVALAVGANTVWKVWESSGAPSQA
jgi:divalent metal cation (Fe/Co/Zn/Cd) transporter